MEHVAHVDAATDEVGSARPRCHARRVAGTASNPGVAAVISLPKIDAFGPGRRHLDGPELVARDVVDVLPESDRPVEGLRVVHVSEAWRATRTRRRICSP